MLENPGATHDDRLDCVAYGVQVWRDRAGYSADWVKAMARDDEPRNPDDWGDDDAEAGKDAAGRWMG